MLTFLKGRKALLLPPLSHQRVDGIRDRLQRKCRFFRFYRDLGHYFPISEPPDGQKLAVTRLLPRVAPDEYLIQRSGDRESPTGTAGIAEEISNFFGSLFGRAEIAKRRTDLLRRVSPIAAARDAIPARPAAQVC